MRSIFTILMVLFALSASAQNNNPQAAAPQENATEVVTLPEAGKTDSLAKVEVEIEQPVVATRATVQIIMHGDAEAILKKSYQGSSSKKVKGFRILIFSDSSPSARGEANAARARFSRLYQKLPAYLYYDNPYFKVTVGNFRTKEEAQRQLGRILKNFPTAFIVHEQISAKEFAK